MSKTTGFCCEALAKEVSENAPFVGAAIAKEAKEYAAFVGGGGLYPAPMRPSGQIEQATDGTWNVNGCCGGGCYVITRMKFCPFCGAALPS